MFNYTKETIINDLNKVIIGTGANGLAAGEFAVKRGGNYKFADILDKKVYKAAGVTGAKGKAKITVATNPTNGTLLRFAAFVATPGSEFVEFGMPNWHEFGKPVIVEFKAGAAAANTAANLANALKLVLNEDNKLFNVTYTANQDNLFIELADSTMDLKDYAFEKEVVTDGIGAWVTEAGITFLMDGTANTVVPAAEFATAKWIVENLRFPSQPNLRYTPLYADEAPVAGTVYNQYSFQYRVKHSVPGGLASVGQVVDAITTHVFYVPVASATTFEGYFTTAGCTIDAATAVSTPKATEPVIDAHKVTATTTVNTSALKDSTNAPITGTATATTTIE